MMNNIPAFGENPLGSVNSLVKVLRVDAKHNSRTPKTPREQGLGAQQGWCCAWQADREGLKMDDALSQKSSKSARSSKSAKSYLRPAENQNNEKEDTPAQGSEDEIDEELEELSENGEESEVVILKSREIEIRFIDAQVEKNLGRDIRRRAEDLAIFRFKLQTESFVPQNLTDEQLIIYLFTAKYNIAAAVTLIRCNYKLRVVLPNLFTSRAIVAQDMVDVWNALRGAPLPMSHAEQQHIVYIGIRMKCQPDRLDTHYAVKLLLMIAEVYHILEGMPCGIILILDADGASYGYFTQKNYEHLKIVIKYVQECMPYNVEAVHVINSTALIKGVFKFIRPFLTKEILRTIFFHKQAFDLLRVLPMDRLPAELGGSCPGTIEEYQMRFREKLERMQEFFEIEEEQRAARYFEQNK